MIKGQGEYGLPFKEDWYFSFFTIFEDAQISLENMKYPLKNKQVKRGETIGLSNEYLGDAKLIVEKGSILLVESRRD